MSASKNITCTRCGDVATCLHNPDEIVRRAYANEILRSVRAREKKEKS